MARTTRTELRLRRRAEARTKWNKRKFVAGVTAGMLLIGGAALADHTVSLSFSDNPVEAGTDATVTATTNRSQGNVQIDICEAVDESGIRTGVYVASNLCADPEAAVWYRFVGTDGLTRPTDFTAQYVFDTTDLGGQTVGFRAIHPPTTTDHPSAIDTKDLVITAPTVTDVHAGCQGIEKAMEKVGNNGKAKTALAKVEDKLGC